MRGLFRAQTLPTWQKTTHLNLRALVPKEKATYKAKAMKRKGNLFTSIISIENLHLADEKARIGKSKQYGVLVHDNNREANIQSLHAMLKNKTYTTSPYTTFIITDPKQRNTSGMVD